MSKGFKCPNCSMQKCEHKSSHLYCPDCESISWDLYNSIFEVGKGKEYKKNRINFGERHHSN